MKRYYLNIADKDIENAASHHDVEAEFESPTVYRILPLDFGGYLAIDPDFIHCYRRRIKTKVVSKKLRSTMKITGFCPIDSYDPITKKTKQGQTLMRYLVASESGEIYMLAFNLDLVHLISAVTNQPNFQEGN